VPGWYRGHGDLGDRHDIVARNDLIGLVAAEENPVKLGASGVIDRSEAVMSARPPGHRSYAAAKDARWRWGVSASFRSVPRRFKDSCDAGAEGGIRESP